MPALLKARPAIEPRPPPGFRRGRALLLVGVLVAGLLPGLGWGEAVAAAGDVAVFPGDSIQALVNANPEGTTFVIKAGMHRRQQVVPKSGDSFIGESGAVLDGEGVTEFAIGAGGVGVTVRGLVIEHYAPPLQKGVIRLGNGAYQWLVEGNEVRYNSGVGIAAGPGWVVRGNYVHHQGQLGVSGSGDDILVEGNEIAFNNTAGIDSHWEAGGSKFVHSRNLVLRNNYVHDNQGPGLWADGNNIYTLYEGNRVINNYGPGIDHEISYDAVIRGNLVEGNGFGWTTWVDGAGILINSSPNVEVYGNTVRNNNDGIAGIHAGRGSGNYGAYQLRNLWVHDNTIVMSVGVTGIVRQGGLTDPVFSSSWNNRFDYNTYTLGSADQYYAWDPWYVTTAQWRAAGQDTHSTWTNTTPTTTTTIPGTTSMVEQVLALFARVLGHLNDISWGSATREAQSPRLLDRPFSGTFSEPPGNAGGGLALDGSSTPASRNGCPAGNFDCGGRSCDD